MHYVSSVDYVSSHENLSTMRAKLCFTQYCIPSVWRRKSLRMRRTQACHWRASFALVKELAQKPHRTCCQGRTWIIRFYCGLLYFRLLVLSRLGQEKILLCPSQFQHVLFFQILPLCSQNLSSEDRQLLKVPLNGWDIQKVLDDWPRALVSYWPISWTPWVLRMASHCALKPFFKKPSSKIAVPVTQCAGFPLTRCSESFTVMLSFR